MSKLLGDEKPKTPRFVPVDLYAEQKKAIAANTASQPAAQTFAAGENAFNLEQLQAMLAKFLPRYNEITGGISDNLVSGLKGEIPIDVQNAVQRNAAVRSLYGGYGGSGMSRNLVARDLGLTSLDITNRSLDAATRWVNATTGALEPLMFRASSFAINPVDAARFAQDERNSKFQRDYVAAQWEWYGSWGQTITRFENTAIQLASSVAGATMA